MILKKYFSESWTKEADYLFILTKKCYNVNKMQMTADRRDFAMKYKTMQIKSS